MEVFNKKFTSQSNIINNLKEENNNFKIELQKYDEALINDKVLINKSDDLKNSEIL